MRFPESRQKEEILGVLVHEMVHCWQHSGFGTTPSGLTEGVADWVRLKAGFAPAHWQRHTDCDWDAGYERTGYFLEWLEEEHGEDVVRRINEAMRGCEYDAEKVWTGCCGKGVEKLWEEYKRSVEKGCDDEGKKKEEEVKNKSEENSDKEVESKEEKAQPEEKERPAPQEDHRTTREKARRGGNMHVPIRPGPSF